MTDIAPQERKFDWVPRFDERSRNYAIRSLLTPVAPRPVLWRASKWRLDQGREGACVGFGETAEILSTPMAGKFEDIQAAEQFARDLYLAARRVDEWEGEEDNGTSVLAGMKVLTAAGWFSEYRWCFSVEDIKLALTSFARKGGGPVVIGIPWYDSMYETLPTGLVKVEGSLVGGHCILLTGYHPSMRIGNERLEVFKWRNSWGPTYGRNGDGYIKVADLAALLADNGEACVPIGRKTTGTHQLLLPT